jgi:hypothetical protein
MCSKGSRLLKPQALTSQMKTLLLEEGDLCVSRMKADSESAMSVTQGLNRRERIRVFGKRLQKFEPFPPSAETAAKSRARKESFDIRSSGRPDRTRRVLLSVHRVARRGGL